eukprot:scaffold625_cov169-Skeletonema_dohrnii-CCMP3373.AAC.4
MIIRKIPWTARDNVHMISSCRHNNMRLPADPDALSRCRQGIPMVTRRCCNVALKASVGCPDLLQPKSSRPRFYF